MKIPINKWEATLIMFDHTRSKNKYFQDLIEKEGYFAALYQFIKITNEKIQLESRLS